jgi:Phosphodiester glycosidase
MTLNLQSRILSSEIKNKCFVDKRSSIITYLLLIHFILCNTIHLLPADASANTEVLTSKSKTATKDSSTTNEACSSNIESQEQIFRLASTSVGISTLVGVPPLGIKSVIQAFSSHLLPYVNLSSLAKTGLDSTISQIWQGSILPLVNRGFNFTNPIEKTEVTINSIPLILISGGKPITIHADSRYQLPDMLAKSHTKPLAAVDGTFFSLKYLTSNVMIGPVLSQETNKFIPGNNSENKKLTGRPLVLISPQIVSYIPFDPSKHNTLEGIQTEMPHVTDAFVAGAWLVKNSQAQPPDTFKSLYGAEVARHRAFWGINQAGIPYIGVSTQSVNSANLAKILVKAGMRDGVMLDSGASTSLAYQGKSLVGYTPRPVPHAIGLLPQSTMGIPCILVANKTKNRGT